MIELAIVNGSVVTPEGIVRLGVGVDGGKVVAIGGEGHLPRANKVIDASGKYVMPGVVDPESHVGHSRPFADDMRTESRAACSSGVTTWGLQVVPYGYDRGPRVVADTPEGVPSYRDVFPKLIEQAQATSAVDFFITPILMTDRHSEEIPRYAAMGVTSYKYYLHQRTPNVSRIWHWSKTLGFVPFNDGTVYLGFENAARLGPPCIVAVHCENFEIARIFGERLQSMTRTDFGAWDESSPHFCEAHHVRSYSYLAKVAGCPIYIQHTTTRESIHEIVNARREGVKIIAQTGPHYLSLTASEGWKINVPLRDKDTIPVLWDALARGVIDALGSDHVAHGRREDLEAEGDVWKTKSGFSSRVETALPVMLSDGVNKGRISFSRLVEVCCKNPALAFGPFPAKGGIHLGCDADIVIVDMDRMVRVSSEMLHTWTGWSIYEGKEFKGWPVMTILGGRLTSEWPQGEKRSTVVEKAVGRHLPRKLMGQNAVGVI